MIKIKEKCPYVVVNSSDIKFKEASEYFLYNYASQNCTPSTFKTYKSLIKSHLHQFFGKIELKSINQNHLKEYIDLKQQEKLSRKRINNSLTLLGNIFNKCIEWRFIAESPYSGIVNIKFSKKSNIQVLQFSHYPKTIYKYFYKQFEVIFLESSLIVSERNLFICISSFIFSKE